MTRGGDEYIEGRGGSENFKKPERGALKKLGGASKICMLQNQQEEGLLKIEPLARGAAKISSFEFQFPHPPLSY